MRDQCPDAPNALLDSLIRSRTAGSSGYDYHGCRCDECREDSYKRYKRYHDVNADRNQAVAPRILIFAHKGGEDRGSA